MALATGIPSVSLFRTLSPPPGLANMDNSDSQCAVQPDSDIGRPPGIFFDISQAPAYVNVEPALHSFRGDCELEAEFKVAEMLEKLNSGSAGHPFLCGAPCKFFRRVGSRRRGKGCREGSECTSCHLCKWTRITNGLNGWQRQQLAMQEPLLGSEIILRGLECALRQPETKEAGSKIADCTQTVEAGLPGKVTSMSFHGLGA